MGSNIERRSVTNKEIKTKLEIHVCLQARNKFKMK